MRTRNSTTQRHGFSLIAAAAAAIALLAASAIGVAALDDFGGAGQGSVGARFLERETWAYSGLAVDVDKFRTESKTHRATSDESRESIGYISGHRSYMGEGLPRSGYVPGTAHFQQIDRVNPYTVFEQIKMLYGTDHVTLEMIAFYEANFWYPEDYPPTASEEESLVPSVGNTGRHPPGRFDY